MKRSLVIATLLLVSLTVDAGETRRHYLVVTKDMKPAYEVTRIHIDNAATTTRVFLIGDQEGPLLRVDIVHDYANHKTTTSYRTFRGSRTKRRLA